MNESWKKLLHGRLNHLLDLAQKTPLGDVSAISRLRIIKHVSAFVRPLSDSLEQHTSITLADVDQALDIE